MRLQCSDCGAEYETCQGGDPATRWGHVCATAKRGGAKPERSDTVNRPAHYNGHPSGVECIQITEHMNFCLGNAIKYIWRADLKGKDIEDLRKARWYLDREIRRRSGGVE